MSTIATHIGVDVGGTFTDIAIYTETDRLLHLHKVPSTPDAPERAITTGLREALERFGVELDTVEHLAHGTTVGTNALIERRIGRIAMVTTAGFRDLLEIGRQTRPKVYDAHCDHPAPLVPRQLRFEITERVGPDGVIYKPLKLSELDHIAQAIANEKVDCVLVCFLNSYAWPDHERQAADRLRAHLSPDVYVLGSSDLFPEFREYERFSTAVLNGALITVMDRYLDNFNLQLRELGLAVAPVISQSAGGLMSLKEARKTPIRASLSGPAAGVIGAATRAAAAGYHDIITIDVGGTSADVSLIVQGRPPEVHYRLLAGFPLRLSSLDVNAVGAGGGSIAYIDRDGLLKVGPQSAGADPGPACYGRGGVSPTVTDANVLLGRLNSTSLLDGAMPIRRDLAEESIGNLARELGLSAVDTALGIVRVACAVMVNAIRSISVERGHDPSRFSLFAYGGAGPLHATQLARALGIRRVVVPPFPGLVCAEGLLHSDLRNDLVRTVLRPLRVTEAIHYRKAISALAEQAEDWFAAEGVAKEQRMIRRFADLRYQGQNFEISLPLECALSSDEEIRALAADFHAVHDATYGFASLTETIELVNLRFQLYGRGPRPKLLELSPRPIPAPIGVRNVSFTSGHAIPTTIWRRRDLGPGYLIQGPAVVEQLDATVLVFPEDQGRVDAWGNIVIEPREDN